MDFQVGKNCAKITVSNNYHEMRDVTMVISITVEAIVYSLLYTAFMLVLFRIQGAKYQLYNYPPAIKARAIEKGITTQAELDAHAKKNRVFGLFV